MYAIYKYSLEEMLPVNVVQAPIVKPLRVDYQNGKPYLWAVVDGARTPVRTIKILRVGTGHPIDANVPLMNYINTTVYQSEPYVWHWFWLED